MLPGTQRGANCVLHPTWGVLNDAYFLAEGETGRLMAVFSGLEAEYGKPAFGGKGDKLRPITDRPIPDRVIRELTDLPRQAAVRAVIQNKTDAPRGFPP